MFTRVSGLLLFVFFAATSYAADPSDYERGFQAGLASCQMQTPQPQYECTIEMNDANDCIFHGYGVGRTNAEAQQGALNNCYTSFPMYNANHTGTCLFGFTCATAMGRTDFMHCNLIRQTL